MFAFIFILILLPLYKNGQIISGWEGAYFLDFRSLLTNRGYSWFEYGMGMVTYSLNFAFVFHLYLLQLLVNSERLVNFVMIFLLYFLPFTAMYVVAKQIGLRSWLAMLIGFFYITNPFMSHFMKSINQWNMLAAFIIPAFFGLIFRLYHSNIRLFTLFGIFSFFFAFTNANPPTMILYQIVILFFVLFASVAKEEKFILRIFIKKYLIVVLSFLLFNFWWIINWLFVFTDAASSYKTADAISWLKIYDLVPALWRAFSLTGLLANPLSHKYDYLNTHFTYTFSPILLSIPLVIMVIALFQKEMIRKHLMLLFTAILVTVFLAKGINPPFGKVYEFMIVHLPLFNVFKSAPEKWGTLLVFLVALYLTFVLKVQRSKQLFVLIVALLAVYIAYSGTPFLLGKFLPDYKYYDMIVGSKMFVDKPEYQRVRKELNQDPLQYRVLSLPGGLNYQVALHIADDRYYTGNDPILNNTNKTFITPHNTTPSGPPMLFFDNISNPNYLKAFPYFNIKKIMINKDEYPWFGFRAKESVPQIESILDHNLASSRDGSIVLYDTGDNFLPKLYVPTNIVITNEPLNKFIDVVGEDTSTRSVFVNDDNMADVKSGPSYPQITFVKINPTKYKIKVENAKDPYLLVFSENFHKGWKAYLRDIDSDRNLYNQVVASYFSGSIKEAALNHRLFYKEMTETVGKTALPEERHFLANWYANGWLVRPEDTNNKGNYEVIIEYWPQRLFYLGTVISVSTLAGCLVIIFFKLKRGK